MFWILYGTFEVFMVMIVRIVFFWVVWHCMFLYVYTIVSEEHAVSIFRVKVCGVRHLLGYIGMLQGRCSLRSPVWSLTLHTSVLVEASCSLWMLVCTCKTTQSHTPEGHSLKYLYRSHEFNSFQRPLYVKRISAFLDMYHEVLTWEKNVVYKHCMYPQNALVLYSIWTELTDLKKNDFKAILHNRQNECLNEMSH
jgi:hypothetical protein